MGSSSVLLKIPFMRPPINPAPPAEVSLFPVLRLYVAAQKSQTILGSVFSVSSLGSRILALFMGILHVEQDADVQYVLPLYCTTETAPVGFVAPSTRALTLVSTSCTWASCRSMSFIDLIPETGSQLVVPEDIGEEEEEPTPLLFGAPASNSCLNDPRPLFITIVDRFVGRTPNASMEATIRATARNFVFIILLLLLLILLFCCCTCCCYASFIKIME
mmetsp:Transcript_4107/g.6048  ORF Transcript_4107/g.6048 Transcript_4107/m.6048 type:complete len:218 (-) Transcript_4107:2162-2815(-)